MNTNTEDMTSKAGNVCAVHVEVCILNISKDKKYFSLPPSATLKCVVDMAMKHFQDLENLKDWIVISGGVVHTDQSIQLDMLASDGAVNICILPQHTHSPYNHLKVSEMISSFVDLRYSEDASSTQTNGRALHLLSLMQPIFLSVLSEVSDSKNAHSKEFDDLFKALKNKVGPLLEIPHITWFDEYGCALIARRVGPTNTCMSLICLDGWCFNVHTGAKKRNHSSSPSVYDPVVLFVGMLSFDQYVQFMQQGFEIIQTASARHDASRSAAGGKQGHQKTPAMIHAIFKQALQFLDGSSEEEISPQGGFTDVGRHTGGSPRNTSWPLLLSVCHFLVSTFGQSVKFRKTMAGVYLCLAEWQSSVITQDIARCQLNSSLSPLDTFKISINAAMQALSKAIDEVGPLVRLGFWPDDIIIFEAQCVRVRYLLEKATHNRAESLARSFTLKPVLPSSLSHRNLYLDLPASDHHTSETSDSKAIYDLINANIGLLPTPPAWNCSFRDLKTWIVTSNTFNVSMSLTFQLTYCCAVERAFWNHLSSAEEHGSGTEVSEICSLVDGYRTCVESVLHNPHNEALMRVELISKELLVVWIAVYIIFMIIGRSENVLQDYGLPICEDDLQHLVLSDRESRDACNRLYELLHHNRRGKCTVFSLRPKDETFSLARSIVHSNANLRNMLQCEMQTSTERQAAHWKVVQMKKSHLPGLDRQLENMRFEETRKNGEVDKCERNYQDAVIGSKAREQAQQQILESRKGQSSIRSQIEAKKKEISSMEQAPPPVLQPLPRNETAACKIVFMLFMPSKLRDLARMTFTAQRLLIPQEMNIVGKDPRGNPTNECVSDYIQVGSPKGSWSEYYSISSSGRLYAVANMDLIHGFTGNLPDSFSKNVRNMNSENDNVWYPDSLQPGFFWNGGTRKSDDLLGGKCYDPFKRVPSIVHAYRFTESLHEAPDQQWSIFVTPPGAERENEPEASQSRAPTCLSRKTDYLTFTNLRTDPSTQLRRLVAALKGTSTDIKNPDFSILVKQTLYHLGDIEMDQGSANLKWWTDGKRCGGFECLLSAVAVIVEEIRYKPRDHEKVLVLSDIARFSSQWTKDNGNVSRHLATISEKWGDDLFDEQRSSSPENVAIIRARRRLFYMYSILCLPHGELYLEDAKRLLRCLVLSNYNRIFEVHTSMEKSLKHLESLVRLRMAHCVWDMKQFISNHPDVITNAVKTVLESTPSKLQWNVEKFGEGETTSYSAKFGEHTYSVNIMTGVVLLDGMPPQGLPMSVTNLSKYQRTFGTLNFEVIRKARGVFQTTAKIYGRFYSFSQGSSTKTVHIFESRDECFSDPFELLDGTIEAIALWAKELPARLKSMHSHWICRKTGTILLRPVSFQKKECQFILRIENFDEKALKIIDCTGQLKFKCMRVPMGLRTEDVFSDASLHKTFDNLIVWVDIASSRTFQVLKRIEPRVELIHSYVMPGKSFLFELPRFALEFEMSDNGSLICRTFSGHLVSEFQQLTDTLHGFDQYMIIQAPHGDKVLIPSGEVNRQHPFVSLSDDDDPEETLSCHLYTIHRRFGTIEAQVGDRAIEARLQLAALYAVCSTLLPEKRTMCTGEEFALQLLRQCWVNRPFRKKEERHLCVIANEWSLCPSLPLSRFVTEISASELSFLYSERDESGVWFDETAAAEYHLGKYCNMSTRMWLTAFEELKIFGHAIMEQQNDDEHIRQNTDVNLMKSNEIFGQTNDSLCDVVKSERSSKGLDKMLDLGSLDGSTRDTEMSKAIMDELQNSWDAFRESPILVPCHNIDENLYKRFEVMYSTCKAHRTQIEGHCLQSLCIISGRYWRSSIQRLRRSVNRTPHATTRDLVKSVDQKETLLHFNPFLSNSGLVAIHKLVLKWMEMCVLEDKLMRLVNLSRCRNVAEISRELSTVKRGWNVDDHPHWLAFEVEQQLQIRDVQHEVATFFLGENKVITQLNMGEGKTRVILPMIVLELVRSKNAVRLNFLSPLMSEAFNFLHHTLTAGLFEIPIYCLPFHRGVSLTSEKSNIMYKALQSCQENGGVVCVTPEHRLSLDLKWHETGFCSGEHSRAIQDTLTMIDNIPFYDIMDESDEILSHKYQLIYAIGNCVPLPSGDVRWTMAQAVLNALQNDALVRDVLLNCSKFENRSSGSDGSFDCIRLIAGCGMDENRRELFRRILIYVLEHPPYGFEWVGKRELRDVMCKCTLETEMTLPQMLSKLISNGVLEDSIAEKMDTILSLRGLLAFGILETCLLKRHRVDYGIDSNRLNTRVAVPYRASDVPANRAQYAQPDTLIVFTLLSYYHRGLQLNEIIEAVKMLLCFGPNAQKDIYNVWFTSGEKAMTTTQRRSLNIVEKLDSSSGILMLMMYEVYKYNMATINFWLSTCVFPRETMQFPKRLSSNAFNLAESKFNVIGFSGTKDMRLLLPIQVRQATTDCDAIRATDGKMAALILQNDTMLKIPSGFLGDEALNLALDQDVDAFIDAGAVMAGISNEEVALKVIERCSKNLSNLREGIVFYDVKTNSWVAKGWDNRTWSLGSSPIQERNAFVYFDEAHCRGADMKLRDHACAMLTVGPGLCKDKLMQAAGRMRKLDRGQSLKFAVPSDLFKKVVGSMTDLTGTRKLLKWVMENTLERVASGMVEWASQGIQFCMTKDPRARVTDDVFGLKELYSGSKSPESISAITTRAVSVYEGRLENLGVLMTKNVSQVLQEIQDHVKAYGSDFEVLRLLPEEECEKEIEHELELVKEVAKEFPQVDPFSHAKWSYRDVLHCRSVQDMPKEVGVEPLGVAIRSLIGDENIQAVRWEECNIFVTRNFIQTANCSSQPSADGENDMGDFLRPVDGLLFFRITGQMILLSEFECGGILNAMWSDSSLATAVTFVNFSQLMSVKDTSMLLSECPMRIPIRGNDTMSDLSDSDSRNLERTLCGLKLFAGLTTFETEESKAALRSLLPSGQAREGGKEIVRLRGEKHMIARSDLEKVCFEE